MATELKFGTSGLRGPVVELNGPPALDYTAAFLNVLAERGEIRPGSAVCIGRDLRASSPEIAGRVADAIRAAGYVAVDCGACPTPALALYAMGRGAPAIMVTGSHIPEDRNGLKFYRAIGEIDKTDELAIAAAYKPGTARSVAGLATETAIVLPAYAARYVDFFGQTALTGLRIGVYQHSSVMRDVAVDILSGLGAEVAPLGFSPTFIPVDTEAVHPDDVARLRAWAMEHGFDAIVSSDGDADRPLVADEHGEVVRGDAVGAIAANLVGADAIVTPLTSNSALEHNRMKAKVYRTKVGSPFVIAGIGQAAADGHNAIVGFEANGGLVLGSDVIGEQGVLPSLPTRDAMLPIIACLCEIALSKKPLSQLVVELDLRAALSNRLQNVPQSASAAFLANLLEEGPSRAEIVAQLGEIANVDTRDGVRFLSQSGEVVYFRASGNAPELRCYVESVDPKRAAVLLEWGLGLARLAVQ